jgi:hypothetical protein
MRALALHRGELSGLAAAVLIADEHLDPVVAEQHHLGAVVLTAQQPRLVELVQWPPEVVVPVGPSLGFEAPASVRMAFEADEGAVAVVPGAVFQSVGVA